MKRWFVWAFVLSVTAVGSAVAAPAEVDVRIEGSATTPFERTITTDAKPVVQDGESRVCDGTNGGASPVPGPTMTGALDEAAQFGGFGWDGTWHDSFEDFYIDRIGPDSTSGTRNWGLVLNWEQTERGGCQTRVGPGDELLFAYDVFTKLHLLKLIAPQAAKVGEEFQVKVVDGATGEAMVGAAIEGVSTGGDGLATLSYDSPGVKTPKATRVDSVRSNAASVCVYEPGTDPCRLTSPPPAEETGPLETEAPVTRINHPKGGERYSRGPRVIRGRVSERGSGIDRTELVVLRRRDGRCSSWSYSSLRFARGGCRRPDPFRVGDTPRWRYHLGRRLGPGRYTVKAHSVDKAGNVGQVHRVRFKVRR